MSQLASLIEAELDRLVRRWTEEVRRRLAPGNESEPELRDHIPDVLRQIMLALRQGAAPSTNPLAREHGRQRHRLGFDLEAVVREYGLLRNLIFDAVERSKLQVSLAELRVLTDFVATSIAEAVSEHARQQSEELLRQANAAHARLEAERQKLHDLFTQAPLAVAIHEGPEHTYTFANPRYRAIVGNRDVVGKPMLEALPELRGQGFDTLFDRVVATGEPHVDRAAPARVDRLGDGQLEDGFYKIVFAPKRNALGQIDGILQCAIDVTEEERARKRLEVLAEQVRESEAELRLVMDSIPMLVSFVGKDERYRTVNRAYEDWFGISRDEVVGKTLKEVVGEAAYAVMGPYARRALSGEHFTVEQRGVPYRHSGTRDVRVTFVPHHDGAGAVAGYVGLLEDVTHRRRAEEEREALLAQTRVAEANHARLLSALADQPLLYVALIRGQELRFEMANAGYRQIVGGRDVVGKTLHEALPELDGQGFDVLLRNVLATGKPFIGRELHVRIDRRGEGVTDAYFNFVYQAVTDSNGVNERVLVVGHDVTDEVLARHLTQRQEQERAEFEQQLIGIVSHDLRNPLNTILLGTVALLRREGLDDKSAKGLRRVQSAGERMLRMVRDLLDFTQARLGGGIAIVPAPMDLHAFARAVVEEAQANFPERAVRLETDGDATGVWDADRLAQVLTNLVSNALKYSAEDSPVTVRTRGEREEVSLEVHNWGVPISPEAVDHLFQPMQRATLHVDKADRSVGLGLYIVKHLVDAHGGSVAVKSSAETGTVFTVRLPRVRALTVTLQPSE